jgi:Kdo2-lipid IVA lauroyltransferase/acyltransferase
MRPLYYPLSKRLMDWIEAIGLIAIILPVWLMPIDWASWLGGWCARRIGPYLPVSRVGRANLRHAYPEKSAAEIETILAGVWDNLGRYLLEYPHLERIWDLDEQGRGRRIETPDAAEFVRLRESGKPAIIFGAHLANWELLAVSPARHGLEVTVLFRPPNNPIVAAILGRIRDAAMGELLSTGVHTAIGATAVLERGGKLGMLVDQNARLGPMVPFFGRPARASAMLAKLARRYDCAVHGARVERLGGARFRVRLTPPLELPPPVADSAADAAAIMGRVTVMVEAWVREHPEQWLWLHRRWR